MKFNLGNHRAHLLLSLAVTLCLASLIGRVRGQDDQEEGEFNPRVVRRQTGMSVLARGRQDGSMSETSVAAASTMMVGEPGSGGTDNNPDSAQEKPSKPAPTRRPVQQPARPDQNRPPKSKNPPVRRPPHGNPEEEDREGDCYDDYGDDYRELIHEPMRHLSRMMNSVFGQISANAPMNPGNAWMRPGRGNSAFASSSSVDDGDGYSRMTSSVSNNGRLRGIISETRNGRTQTRRIGRDDDEEAEEDVGSNPGRYMDDNE